MLIITKQAFTFISLFKKKPSPPAGNGLYVCLAYRFLIVAAASYKDENVVHQRSQRPQSSHHIGIGGPLEGILRLVVGSGIGHTRLVQPRQSPLAGIDFDRQRNETEERSSGKQDDTHEHDLGHHLYGEDTDQQNPLYPVRSKADKRNQRRAQRQKRIGPGMLYRMAALVGSHSRSSHAVAVVDLAAEVDRVGRRVVVVGQLRLTVWVVGL